MSLLDGVHFDDLEGGGSGGGGGGLAATAAGSFRSQASDGGGGGGGGSFRKSLDVNEARQGRVQRSVEIRKRKRGAAARAKRRRALETGAQDAGEHPGYSADQVTQAIQDIGTPGKTAQAVINLRTWLSFAPRDTFDADLPDQHHQQYADMHMCNDVAMDLCAERGMAEKMLPLLRVGAQVKETDHEHELALNATWCITNLASGTARQTKSTVCAASALAKLVNRAPRKLQEQAAWALGNMAAEEQEVREELQRLGLIPPLVILLREPRTLSGLRVKRTAAWALCNLARGNQTSGKPFFSAAAHLALAELLEAYAEEAIREGPSSDAGALMVEVLWTVTFLSAKEPNLCIIMVHQNILKHLVRLFTGCEGERAICVPALRALSNLVPLRVESPPGRNVSLVTAVCQQPGYLDALQRMLAEGAPATQVQEALWALANLLTLGLQTRTSVSLELSVEEKAIERELIERFTEPICIYFTRYTSEVVLAAATALANLANRVEDEVLIRVMTIPTSPRVIDSAVALLRYNDVEIVYRALDLVEMVLVRLSNPFAATRLGGRSGVQLVMDYEGIEALEYLEMRDLPEAHASLSGRAHYLVDRFFGVDFEESQAAEELQPPERGLNMFRFPASGPSSPPAPAPSTAPAAGRGAHLLKPAWLVEQERQQQQQQQQQRMPGQQQPGDHQAKLDAQQRTLPECGFGTKMDL